MTLDINCTHGRRGYAPCGCAICLHGRLVGIVVLGKRRPDMAMTALRSMTAEMGGFLDRMTAISGRDFLNSSRLQGRPDRTRQKRDILASRRDKLARALAERPDLAASLARALRVEAAVVRAIAAGKADLPPRKWRTVFATIAGRRT